MIHQSNNERFVLVRAPELRDTQFLARWLAVATDINGIILEHFNGGSELFRGASFSLAAGYFVRLLIDGQLCFFISTSDRETAAPAMMDDLCFFRRIGDGYRMILPGCFSPVEVLSAFKTVGETESGPYLFHPEPLLATLDVDLLEQRKQVTLELETLQSDLVLMH